MKNNLKKLSVNELLERLTNAPDFGYDDEAIEMKRRGLKWKWSPLDEAILTK